LKKHGRVARACQLPLRKEDHETGFYLPTTRREKKFSGPQRGGPCDVLVEFLEVDRRKGGFGSGSSLGRRRHQCPKTVRNDGLIRDEDKPMRMRQSLWLVYDANTPRYGDRGGWGRRGDLCGESSQGRGRATGPGTAPLTRMPRGCQSTAQGAAKLRIAALVARYTLTPARLEPATEDSKGRSMQPVPAGAVARLLHGGTQP